MRARSQVGRREETASSRSARARLRCGRPACPFSNSPHLSQTSSASFRAHPCCLVLCVRVEARAGHEEKHLVVAIVQLGFLGKSCLQLGIHLRSKFRRVRMRDSHRTCGLVREAPHLSNSMPESMSRFSAIPVCLAVSSLPIFSRVSPLSFRRLVQPGRDNVATANTHSH
jgi:hypothetical protein